MARSTRGTNHDHRPMRARAYLDAATAHGLMAALLVAVASLTGGDQARAILVAVVFFFVATPWTGWRLQTRRDARGQARRAARASASRADHANGGGREAG